MKEPLVSVLMTAFNREKFIATAIESVLASTYTNFELIIVDDRSSDNTLKIAKEYQEKDPRIKIFENDVNLGDYPNRNRAASHATGKYIKYLDSDDIIYPHGLQVMVAAMEKYPDAGFGLIPYRVMIGFEYPQMLTPAQAYEYFFFKGAFIHCGPSSSIINREAFYELGAFEETAVISDTSFWLKMAKKKNLVALPNDLVLWREHDSQEMNKETIKGKKIKFLRYHMLVDELKKNDCPLSEMLKDKAINNQKKIKVAEMAGNLVKFRIKKAIELHTKCNLSLQDYFSVLK